MELAYRSMIADSAESLFSSPDLVQNFYTEVTNLIESLQENYSEHAVQDSIHKIAELAAYEVADGRQISYSTEEFGEIYTETADAIGTEIQSIVTAIFTEGPDPLDNMIKGGVSKASSMAINAGSKMAANAFVGKKKGFLGGVRTWMARRRVAKNIKKQANQAKPMIDELATNEVNNYLNKK